MKIDIKQIAMILATITFASCSDGIISESPSSTHNIKIRANFASIQTELFNKNCISCHSGTEPSGGLDLNLGKSYMNLINKQNGSKSGIYIEPNNSANSILFQRVNSSTDPMPASGKLPQYMIDSLKLWIDSGALNN